MFSQPPDIYIPNYPPPPLPFAYDSSVNNRIETFKHRFEHYLANRNANIQIVQGGDKQFTNEKLKLCDVTDEMRQSYDLMDQLKVESASLLNETNRLSDIEWNEKMDILRTKQKRMIELTEKYRQPVVQATIETKLKRRQEKRARIQKRKKETSKLRQLRIKTRREKHRLIDEWFQETAQTIEKQRHRAEEEQRIERILADVKRKKSEAVKNINLMESLIELHRVRRIQKSLNDRCEHKIVDELAMLRAQWHSAHVSYEAEEQKLRKYIKSNGVYDEWQSVLFGANDDMQPNEMNLIHDMDDLIRIRSAWDAFIVAPSSFSGSSIPIGWITPKVNPIAEWNAYKIPEK